MTPYWSNGRVVLWQGHVLDALAAMEAQSVHCAISSPPYWGLRDYDLPSLEWPAVSYAPMAGLPPLDIPGCDAGCEHVWGEEIVTKKSGGKAKSTLYKDGRPETAQKRCAANAIEKQSFEASQGQYCQLCGGWRGSLGLEPIPEMFVGHIVLVARELWRVLRDDGTFWLNLGSSYASGRLAQSEVAYGSDDTRRSDSRASDPVCRRSCGARPGGCPIHLNRKDHTCQEPHADDAHPCTTARDNGHRDCVQASPGALPLDVQVSTIPSSSCCGRDACDHGATVSACPLGTDLTSDETHQCEHRSACRRGIVAPGQTSACHKSDTESSFSASGTSTESNVSSLSNYTTKPQGFKAKDLIPIPWMVAMALQADGWYLRSSIIWAKGVSFCPTYSGSCMPESVRDRPTKGHEYVFLLSKNKRYFYDGDAVREQGGDGSTRWGGATMDLATQKAFGGDAVIGQQANRPMRTFQYNGTRNLRTVWTINPGSYAGAHFATFPPALVEPMIKAGTSQRGCCPKCKAPWVRVTSKEFVPQQDVSREKGVRGNGNQKPLDKTDGREGYPRGTTAVTTTGWTPTCSCDAGEPVPCTVLDPFAGTFTTGQEAIKLGRRAVGIELSKSYCDDHIIPRLSKGIQMEMGL